MARETEYRLYGEVLWYDTTLEFGFIRPNDGRADLYVHRNSVRSKDNLVKGEVVEYRLRQYPNYLTEAIDITGLEEGPVQLHGSGGRDSVVDQTKVCDNCGFKGHETRQCYNPVEEEVPPEEANAPSKQEGSA